MARIASRRQCVIETYRVLRQISFTCTLGDRRSFSDEGSSVQAGIGAERRLVGYKNQAEHQGKKRRADLSKIKGQNDDSSKNLHPSRSTTQNDIIRSLQSLVSFSKARNTHPDEFNAMEKNCEALSKQILEDLDNLTGFLLAKTIHCFRVCGYWDLGFFTQLFRFASRKQELVARVHPIGVVMSIQSLGMMAAEQKRKQNQEALELFKNEGWEFLVKLVEACEARYGFQQQDFKGRELSSMLHGLGCYSASIRWPMEKREWMLAKVGAILRAFLEKSEDDNLDLVSPKDFSVALHGLANVQFKDVSLLNDVGESLKKVLAGEGVHLNEHSLAATVWSLSKVGLKDPKLLELLGKRIAAQAQSLNSQGLPNVVYGFGVLGYKDEHLLTVLGQEISEEEKLGKLTEQGLANIVYGFGLLGFFEEKVLAALGNEISKQHRLKRFAAQELANMVYGFGLLDYNNRILVSRLGSEVSKPHRLAKFIAQGLSNVVYGLGLVKYCDVQALEGLAKEVVKPQRLQEFTAQGLTNIVYGFGLCGLKNGQILNRLGAEIASQTRIDTFTDQGLALVIYGFGKSSFFDGATFSVLLDQVRKRVGRLSPQEISTVLYGFAMVEASATERFAGSMVQVLECVAEEIGRRGLEGFNEQALCNICWSLSQLRYLDVSLMDRLISASRIWDAEPNRDTTKSIAMILEACAVLTIEHQQFFQLSQSYVLKNSERMSSRDAVHLMWSMAVLGILTPEHFECLCKWLFVLGIGGQNLGSQKAMQIAQASLYVTVIDKQKLDPSLTSMVQLAKDCCVIPPLKSSFEKDIQKKLLDKGVSIDTDQRLVGDVLPVDIFVSGNPGLVIECDGPTHYTINKVDGEYRQMGSTIFRNRLLEASGYKVVCLPFFLDDQARSKVLCDALGLEGFGPSCVSPHHKETSFAGHQPPGSTSYSQQPHPDSAKAQAGGAKPREKMEGGDSSTTFFGPGVSSG